MSQNILALRAAIAKLGGIASTPASNNQHVKTAVRAASAWPHRA
jgi:hypothetical protein